MIADSNHIKEVAIKKASLIVKNKELRDDFEGKINAMRLYNREQFELADKRLT